MLGSPPPRNSQCKLTSRSASFSKSPGPPLPKSCGRNPVKNQCGPFPNMHNLLRYTGNWGFLRAAMGFSLCPASQHKLRGKRVLGSVTEVCAQQISTQTSAGCQGAAPTLARLGQAFPGCLEGSTSIVLGYRNKSSSRKVLPCPQRWAEIHVVSMTQTALITPRSLTFRSSRHPGPEYSGTTWP